MLYTQELNSSLGMQEPGDLRLSGPGKHLHVACTQRKDLAEHQAVIAALTFHENQLSALSAP